MSCFDAMRFSCLFFTHCMMMKRFHCINRTNSQTIKKYTQMIQTISSLFIWFPLSAGNSTHCHMWKKSITEKSSLEIESVRVLSVCQINYEYNDSQAKVCTCVLRSSVVSDTKSSASINRFWFPSMSSLSFSLQFTLLSVKQLFLFF